MAMEVSVRILEDVISTRALDRGGEMAWGTAGGEDGNRKDLVGGRVSACDRVRNRNVT